MRNLLRKQVTCKIMIGGFLIASSLLTGCASTNKLAETEKTYTYPVNERNCLERVMYFESNRSSREGMIGVGTVVMNRVNSSAYPNTICGVVGQKNQFAPGVLTKPMTEAASLERVREAADAVLRGERSKKVKNAMFFHTAGLSFPYNNMHYVHIAGGNAFYEKRNRDGSLQVPTRDSVYDVALAYQQDVQQNPNGVMPNGAMPNGVTNEATNGVMSSITAPSHNQQNISNIDPIETSSIAMGYAQPSQEKLSEIGDFLLRNNKY